MECFLFRCFTSVVIDPLQFLWGTTRFLKCCSSFNDVLYYLIFFSKFSVLFDILLQILLWHYCRTVLIFPQAWMALTSVWYYSLLMRCQYLITCFPFFSVTSCCLSSINVWDAKSILFLYELSYIFLHLLYCFALLYTGWQDHCSDTTCNVPF